MSISLHIENLSKKFGTHWVLKAINLNIYPTEKIAILGSNGSGKSTLLRIIAGFLYFNKGVLAWKEESTGELIESPNFAYSAPYLDLFEHLTVKEHFEFHFKQKSCVEDLSMEEIIGLGKFEDYQQKQIRQLSSGVRQRFKNTLAILSKSDVLFLDEPCSNLDENNIQHFQNLASQFTKNKMVVVASNNPVEYDFLCSKEFRIENCELKLLRNKQLWA